MSEHSLFAANVLAHLVALMSGIVSFGLALWAEIKKKPHHSLVFWIIGGLSLLVAFDQAWRDEHHTTQTVVEQKSDLTSKLNVCSNELRVATDKATFFEKQTLTNQQTINDQMKTMNSQQQTANSQQNAMNSCVVALGKANTPEPEKIALTLKAIEMGEAKHITYGVLMTNKVITPVRVVFGCEKQFKKMTATINAGQSTIQIGAAGSPMPIGGGWTGSIIEISSPAWTPINPLMVTLYHDGEDVGKCNFQKQ